LHPAWFLGSELLDASIQEVRRGAEPAFVQLQHRITAHRPAIDAALDTGPFQGLVESPNTKGRLLTRVAGFHGHEPLVALAMLALGSHPTPTPGRQLTHGNNKRARYCRLACSGATPRRRVADELQKQERTRLVLGVEEGFADPLAAL
jgi:hypothetical protein